MLLRLRRRGSPGPAIARVAPHPLTWVAALAGGYVPGTAAIELSAMECSCEYSGECVVEPRWRHHGLGAFLEGIRRGWHFECAATDDASCAASGACRNEGRCAAVEGACRATSRADCLATRRCREHGSCTPVDGECRPAGDDCRHTTDCRERGECGAVDGQCIAVDERDCAVTEGCRRWGNCAVVYRRSRRGPVPECGPTRPEHCIQSRRCAEDHQLSLIHI